jgi:hypothetical protein
LKRKLILAVLAVIALVIVAGAYVAFRVRNELVAARSALTQSPAELNQDSINDADVHLAAALDELNSPVAKVLRFIPIARQNLVALERVARDTRPVLEAAGDLNEVFDRFDSEGLLRNGRVDIGLVDSVREPLQREVDRLHDLEQTLERHRTGWLLPPLWDELNQLLIRVQSLHAGARKAAGLAEVAGGIFGGNGPRTYLIVLLNNAELRGAGGIPSGLGTLEVDEGRLSLGEFFYAPELRGPRPYKRVPAPVDFRRRWGRFWADRTFWVNTTLSSDVPDVALVASRLFKAIPGVSTDGVLLADPHGVAALMQPEATIGGLGKDRTIAASELAQFAYSDVYKREAKGSVLDRHDELLRIGQLAFKEILNSGIGGRPQLIAAGKAIGGGHLRFISFDPREQLMLEAAGATGDLQPPEGDVLFVTAYNEGADKLDFWARRSIEHTCAIEGDAASCTTSVTLTNQAPDGLPPIVAGKPYGVLTSFLEVYIPESAEVTFVERDQRETRYLENSEDGHTAVGFDLRLEPGESTTVAVGYDLELEGGYSLEVIPQPLTHDAELQLSIDPPEGWLVIGPGESTASPYRFEGPLDGHMEVIAKPSQKAGLSAFWEGLVHFWTEPLGS